jgi:dihydrolipoamide dehydrogenase
VAWVGLTEAQVRASGQPYKLGRFPFSANSRAKLQHEGEGFVKVISSTDDYRILGVHMIGPAVSEFIGEACLAMEFYADSEDVARVCHPPPHVRRRSGKPPWASMDGQHRPEVRRIFQCQ